VAVKSEVHCNCMKCLHSFTYTVCLICGLVFLVTELFVTWRAGSVSVTESVVNKVQISIIDKQTIDFSLLVTLLHILQTSNLIIIYGV